MGNLDRDKEVDFMGNCMLDMVDFMVGNFLGIVVVSIVGYLEVRCMVKVR